MQLLFPWVVVFLLLPSLRFLLSPLLDSNPKPNGSFMLVLFRLPFCSPLLLVSGIPETIWEMLYVEQDVGLP